MTPPDPGGSSSAEWARIDALFDEALDLPPDGWAAFIAERCADEPAIGEAVLRLLEATLETRSFLESTNSLVSGPLLGEVADALERESAVASQSVVPKYRLLREIGRGGTGTVYLAERENADFGQRVALKLLRRGLDTDDIVRRFMAERRILGSLSHPGIATLIDGGATEDGRPFLVMEYVEGEPITAYCDRHRLGIGERLRLFTEVAAAVQYAHRNLVIHRDLKPTNILVTAEGSIKLLDFGIAKLLSPDQDDASRPHTRTGVRPMTLRFASPEQVSGDPITTATDVYQLGVLLYMLLTGRHPLEADLASPAALERAVRESEPTRPSVAVGQAPSARTATSVTLEEASVTHEEVSAVAPATAAQLARLRGTEPGRLRRALRGDLDVIVLKALRKEPERRYASADAMVADIERHLRGLPIRARPDTLGYRARSFARRQPMLVALIALALASAGVYIWTLTNHARRLEAERNRARLEAAKAEQVRDFLIDLFRVADPSETRGHTVTAREILDAGAQRIRTELHDQPALKAELLTTMATVYLGTSLHGRARPLIEEALELREATDPRDSAAIALNLHQLANAVARTDRRDAIEYFERALAAAERAYGPDAPQVAAVLRNYALNLDPADPERWRLFDRALAILRDGEDDVREELATLLAATTYGAPDTLFDGIARLREALEIRRELYGEEHPLVATSLSDLALALEPSDPESAEAMMRHALEIHRNAAGESHTTTLTLANNLAGLLRDRGELDEAESLYREVLRIRRAEFGGEPVLIAYPAYGLGQVLLARGRPGEAEPLLREVAEAFPVGDLRGELARAALGRALIGQRRYAEAEAVLLAALDSAAGDEVEADRVALLLEPLAELYEAWDRTAAPDSLGR